VSDVALGTVGEVKRRPREHEPDLLRRRRAAACGDLYAAGHQAGPDPAEPDHGAGLCHCHRPTVQSICQQAASRGGRYNQVFALAESAGAITNFNLLNWTQPVMFQLINPLLGNNCTIGTFGNPVVLNPALSVGPGGMLTLTNDPNPARNPDTFILAITQAVAGDNTFSAPGVTNCGPGGPANIAVGAALDAGTGLPAASGNSLALNGSFQVAATEASGDPAVAQPANNAAILLNAFKYSTRNGHGQKISMATFKHALKHG
jgi:hypothetical protein